MRVILAVGRPGMTRIEHISPRISVIREAAALLRPIMLEDDEVSHRKVMKSLGLLALGSSAKTKAQLDAIRGAWEGDSRGDVLVDDRHRRQHR